MLRKYLLAGSAAWAVAVLLVVGFVCVIDEQAKPTKEEVVKAADILIEKYDLVPRPKPQLHLDIVE